jgi:hypothetical protein
MGNIYCCDVRTIRNIQRRGKWSDIIGVSQIYERCLLASSRLSFHSYAWSNSASTGRIFIKLDIKVFAEYVGKFQIFIISDKNLNLNTWLLILEFEYLNLNTWLRILEFEYRPEQLLKFQVLKVPPYKLYGRTGINYRMSMGTEHYYIQIWTRHSLIRKH